MLSERDVSVDTPPEDRPLRRVRHRIPLHDNWPECDCPGCWKLRPMTDGEIRAKDKKQEAKRAYRLLHKDENLAMLKEKYSKTRWQLRNIVAWDGEGANTETGHHYYNLLANSRGEYICPDNGMRGIGTKEAFDFFLNHNQRSAINVIFGGSYDVNMILKDMPEIYLKALWADGRCKWDGYRITWTPRKRFGVTPYKWSTSKRKFIADSKSGFVLWDVFGFFQCAFVEACRAWGILDDLQCDAMQVMKWARSTFTVDKLDDIKRYNQDECAALVTLVRRLFDAMDEAGIQLERYDGAGAIATALLKLHHVYDYAGDRPEYLGDTPSPVYRAAQVAYSGGRIEAVYIGNHEGPVYRYDINSAYPAACIHIPSLKGAIWKREEEWNGNPLSIVYCDVHLSEEMPFYPLWWRGSVGPYRGQIYYPRYCSGAYYGVEFQNLSLYWKEGRDYTVRYAMNVYLDDDTKPFEWLTETYQIRLRLKKEGNLAQMVLRLGMNSLYGKCAQQEGYQPNTHGYDIRYPGTHHLVWAGFMTAYTRAKLYQAAMTQPEKVLAFATDAVFTTAPLSLDVGTGLGQWSPEDFAGIMIVQAGVYWLKEQTGEWKSKYRGFDPGSLIRDEILDRWRQHSYTYPATLTRFCGLGSALGRTKGLQTDWRQWITDDRMLNLVPTGKRSVAPGHFEPWKALTLTQATDTMDGGESMPYPVLWVDGEKGVRDTVDGTDMRILEEEWEDSYE